MAKSPRANHRDDVAVVNAVPEVQVWQPVYVGIGSNLKGPVRQVREAIGRLAEVPATRLVLVSALVRSPPLGGRKQPEYINAVAALLTQLSPTRLLDQLQRIELEHGRLRGQQRWESRTLDLDILAFGNRRIATARLTLPHPHLHERSFVLGPLSELAPELWIEGLGRVSSLAAKIDVGDLRPLDSNDE